MKISIDLAGPPAAPFPEVVTVNSPSRSLAFTVIGSLEDAVEAEAFAAAAASFALFSAAAFSSASKVKN